MRLKEMMPALTRYGSMIGIAADPMVHVEGPDGTLTPIHGVERRDGCIVLKTEPKERTTNEAREMMR